MTYQGVLLKNWNKKIERIERKKEEELSCVTSSINCRLKKAESDFLSTVTQILFTLAWESKRIPEENNFEFDDDDVIKFYDRFETPLDKAGLSCSSTDILQEWHDLVEYIIKFLRPTTTNYMKTWKKIFNSPKSEANWKNILLIIKAAFCLPVTTVKVERSFSMLKRIKRDTRASLNTYRLENFMRIGQEGPSLNEFDATPLMTRWLNKKIDE